MARFDVFEHKAHTLLVDVRADDLERFGNRVMVPLLPRSSAPRPIALLNPVFANDGQNYVFMTQLLASVPCRALRSPVGNIAAHQDDIVRALDVLFIRLLTHPQPRNPTP